MEAGGMSGGVESGRPFQWLWFWMELSCKGTWRFLNRGMTWSNLSFIGITLSWVDNRNWRPRTEAGNQIENYWNNLLKALAEEIMRSSKEDRLGSVFCMRSVKEREELRNDSRVFGLKNWKGWVDTIIWKMQCLWPWNKAANSINGKIFFCTVLICNV